MTLPERVRHVIAVDKQKKLCSVANRVSWGIFRERKDSERESSETFLGSHLLPMGLNVLG